MASGITTFTNYLEEAKKKETKTPIKFVTLSHDIVKSRITELPLNPTDRELEINFILRRINMSDEEYLKHMEIFYHFKDLSNYMEEANLSYRETFSVVMYMLKRNLACLKRVKEAGAINDAKLIEYKFENISQEELNQLFSSGEINRVINGSDEELTEREQEIRDEILKHKEFYSSDIDELIKEHMAIKTHYLDKLSTFDESDIEALIANLRLLTFSEDVCSKISHLLHKQLESRNNAKLKESTIVEHYTYEVKEEVPSLPYKERKDAYNYIREYYNIPKKEVLKSVTYKEMLNIVSLMLKLDIDLKSIRNYIRQVLASLEQEQNPANKYEIFKSKLAYYLDESQMEYLDELYEAFKDDEELWMSEFIAYLEEVMQFVSETDSYTYELETAKQLLKIENGN